MVGPIVVMFVIFLCPGFITPLTSLLFPVSHVFDNICFTVTDEVEYPYADRTYTDNLLYTDTRYNDKIRYNDNLNVTKPSLKR